MSPTRLQLNNSKPITTCIALVKVSGSQNKQTNKREYEKEIYRRMNRARKERREG